MFIFRYTSNQSYINGYINSKDGKNTKTNYGSHEKLEMLCSEAIVRILHVTKLMGRHKAEIILEYDKVSSA